MEFTKRFFTALLSTLILDFLWLGFIAKDFYDKHIGFLLRKTDGALDPIWPSAFMVYIAITLGIVVFVVPKAEGSKKSAFLLGALFGAILYGVYDFTNHATLANWPFRMVVVDVIWGACLCGAVSVITTHFQPGHKLK